MKNSIFFATLVVFFALANSGSGPNAVAANTQKHNCYLPAAPGNCLAYFPSWFFNVQTGKCEQFIYGGCGGNSNRFETEQECKQTCGSAINVCLFPKKTGPCYALFYRWYFNPIKGQCEEFVYGGCEGNGNNFETESECEAVCE